MRYLSLFSGIESASQAWIPLGWECVGVAEIEPFPCKVLAHHYPDVPNLGSVTEITKEQVESLGHIDLVVGGFPCFQAGTKILTYDGYRNIENLLIGDLVLTHTGSWKPVTSVMKSESNKLRKIKGAGVIETITTDEHPYYIRKASNIWDNKNRTNRRCFSEPSWVEAKDISSSNRCFAGQVLPKVIDDIDHSAEWYWVVGRYLADGWIVERKNRKTGRIVICCGKHEFSEVKERLSDAGLNFTVVEEDTVYKFHICRKELFDFLTPFGRLAHGKKLPSFCLELPRHKAESLFNGWATGDGWRNDNHKQWSVTTVSKSLALGMALLAQRAFGIVAGVYYAKMPLTCIIEGRTCSQRGQYTVRVCDRNKSSFIDGDYGWKLLRQSDACGAGVVYNISVQDDESYMANGAIVHNCQDLSIAGKRKGLRNEDGSATRSGLFFTAMRIVEWAKPRWVVVENVPGLYSSQKGRDFASVVGEMAGCEFDVPRDGWKNSGCAVGKNGLVEWITLDAQYCRTPEYPRAVPQRRRRVFVVRDSGDWQSRKPLFLESKGLCGNPPPSRKTREEITYNSIQSIASSGNDVAKCMTKGTGQRLDFETDDFIAHVFALAGNTIGRKPENSGNGNGFDESEASYTLTKTDVHAVAFHVDAQPDEMNFSAETSATLTRSQHAGVAIGWIGELTASENVAGTIQRGGKGGRHDGVMTPQMQVRRLTPIECARLQAFPDDFLSQVKGYSDSAAYKALGNSMACNVMAIIGQKIHEASLII